MASHGRIYSRVQRGKLSYYIDFGKLGRVYAMPSPDGGQPITIRDEATAEAIRDSVNAAVARQKISLEKALAPWISRLVPRFGELYDKWLERMRERVASGELSRAYVDELARYRRSYLEPLSRAIVADLTYGHFEDLVAALGKRGLSAKTRAHVLRAVKTFLTWLWQRGELAAVPPMPTMRLVPTERKLLEPEVQRRVLDAIPEEQRGIFLALAYHGLRPIEACRLEVADYDWESGLMRPRANNMKTKASRVIPCSEELVGWLRARGRRLGGPLFQNPSGRADDKRWVVDSMGKVWDRACRLVGADAPLYSGTKHSSATAARRRGVPLEVIQRALGHADSRSTAIYAKAAELAPVGVLRGGKR